MARCKGTLTFYWLIGLLLATGCGGEDWGKLSGTVTLGGEPVGPGSISLRPTDPDQPGAMGFFMEDGKYTIFSSGRKEGATAGEYQVLIRGGTPEELTAETAGPRPKSKIPPRYATPAGSDLTVTIESGSKTHDFELKP